MKIQREHKMRFSHGNKKEIQNKIRMETFFCAAEFFILQKPLPQQLALTFWNRGGGLGIREKYSKKLALTFGTGGGVWKSVTPVPKS